jgi:hypothetical protein
MGGESFADRYARIRPLLAPSEPFEARWSSGATTSVSTELGEPFDLCAQQRKVTYRVGLGVNSADGRVSTQQDATGFLQFEPGGSPTAWGELQHFSGPLEPSVFADATGISGVDLGGISEVSVRTALYLGGRDEAGSRVGGDISVTTVENDSVSSRVETLDW